MNTTYPLPLDRNAKSIYESFLQKVIEDNGDTIPFQTFLYKASNPTIDFLYTRYLDGLDYYSLCDWTLLPVWQLKHMYHRLSSGDTFNDFTLNILSKLPNDYKTSTYLEYRTFESDQYLREATHEAQGKAIEYAIEHEVPVWLVKHYENYIIGEGIEWVELLFIAYKYYKVVLTPREIVDVFNSPSINYLPNKNLMYIAILSKLVPSLKEKVESKTFGNLLQLTLVEIMYAYNKLDLIPHIQNLMTESFNDSSLLKKIRWYMVDLCEVSDEALFYLTLNLPLADLENVLKIELDNHKNQKSIRHFISNHL